MIRLASLDHEPQKLRSLDAFEEDPKHAYRLRRVVAGLILFDRLYCMSRHTSTHKTTKHAVCICPSLAKSLSFSLQAIFARFLSSQVRFEIVIVLDQIRHPFPFSCFLFLTFNSTVLIVCLFQNFASQYMAYMVYCRTMGTIAEGVEFDTIAREWRCKWSGDNDKKSLVEAQKALKEVIADVQKVDGFQKTDRVVCGGCMDFKVITSLPAEKFGAWEENKFAPEEAFLAKLRAIDGITEVETQTYTLMPVAP